jgi:hypothetical protein
LPLTALQAHVSYTIRRGLWAAFDSTWYGVDKRRPIQQP